MSVDVHAPRHYDHAVRIQRGRATGQARDDPTVLNAHIANFTVDVVGRIVDCATDDSELLPRWHQDFAPVARALATLRRMSAADAGPASMLGNGNGTSSIR
jgi:hypothetical protein